MVQLLSKNPDGVIVWVPWSGVYPTAHLDWVKSSRRVASAMSPLHLCERTFAREINVSDLCHKQTSISCRNPNVAAWRNKTRSIELRYSSPSFIESDLRSDRSPVA